MIKKVDYHSGYITICVLKMIFKCAILNRVVNWYALIILLQDEGIGYLLD